MQKKWLMILVSVLLALGLLSGCAEESGDGGDGQAAANFPTKQIEIVVPFDPGGASDLSIRAIAPYLEQQLGQPVMVNNIAGANGVSGTHQVANSAADGYTLVWISTRPNLPEMYSDSSPYTSADLRPVAECVETAGAITVRADSDIYTIDDLVAYIEANPGIKYGHSGRGNKNHMTSVVFADTYGLSMSDVPYSGDNDALTSLLRGDVDFIFAGCMPALPHVEAGSLRIITVLNEERVAAIPEVPALKETAYPVDNIISYIGIFAPAGTPDEIVQILQDAAAEAMQDQELQASLIELGLVPSYRSAADFQVVIDEYYEYVAPLVIELGLFED